MCLNDEYGNRPEEYAAVKASITGFYNKLLNSYSTYLNSARLRLQGVEMSYTLANEEPCRGKGNTSGDVWNEE